MFNNYFKVMFRNLLRNKAFSAINIIGLAVGMASAILIFLWIQNEMSYDQFHEKKDRIYEAWNRVADNEGQLDCWSVTPQVLAGALERDLPEVEMAVRVNWPSNYLFTVGDKRMMRTGNIVDTGFLQMFSFPVIKGSTGTALNDRHSIVLTQKLAKALFGDEDAMGKVVKLNEKDNHTVTAVLKDLPSNTRFSFEYLLPWTTNNNDSSWDNHSALTYVMLRPNSTLASIEPKVRSLKQRYSENAKKRDSQLFLYPMERWRLYSNFTNGVEDGGRITFVKLFAIIGVFILLIACINFMNLSTARSEKRAKEVGIRKVAGATRLSLIGQFIGESILLSSIAAIVALGIVVLCLPAFNQLTDKALSLDLSSFITWALVLGFILITGVLAGSYPAFFLSSFQPVKALKGTFKKAHALVTPRKVLVVIQFTFAILLIICTFVVKQQIDHAKDRQIGYNKDNLIYSIMNGDVGKNYALIKNELLSSGVASSVARTNSPVTQIWSNGGGQEWEGKDPDEIINFDHYAEDEGLAETIGLQFVQGRDLDLRKFPTDSSGIIINEAALEAIKFKDPIGKIVREGDRDWHIVGVVKNFIVGSPYTPVKPMLIYGAGLNWLQTILIRLNGKNDIADNLKGVEAVFKKYNPAYPFEYKFVDEEYDKKFENEKRQGTLATLFAGLAIFISCLGLFGLAAYMAENRVKEIGVRKVLGASVASITRLLSSDFIKLVLVSFAIAAPIAYWAMNLWLQGYSYRVSIQWWVFALSGGMAILIAFVTISFQAIKAAMANPVKSLRTE